MILIQSKRTETIKGSRHIILPEQKQETGNSCYPNLTAESNRYESGSRADGGKVRNHTEAHQL